MRILCFCLIWLVASTSAADNVLWEGDHRSATWIDLPVGYYWRDLQGIDSLPGEMLTEKGGIVHFDIGFFPLVESVDQKPLYTKHKTQSGTDVLLAKSKDLPHRYSASINGVNGSFTWRSYDQTYTDEIVEIIGSLKYDKFIEHAKKDLSHNPIIRIEKELPSNSTRTKKIGTIIHRITPNYKTDRIQNIIASDLFSATQEGLFFEPTSVKIFDFEDLHSFEVIGVSRYHDFDLHFRFVYIFGLESTYRVHQWAPKMQEFEELLPNTFPDASPVGLEETLRSIQELTIRRLPFLKKAATMNREAKEREPNEAPQATPTESFTQADSA